MADDLLDLLRMNCSCDPDYSQHCSSCQAADEIERLQADNAALRDVVQSLYDTLEGKWEHGARVGHDDLRIAGAMVEEVGCG